MTREGLKDVFDEAILAALYRKLKNKNLILKNHTFC